MTAPVSPLAALLDELERAHAAATPGPWEVLPEAGIWASDPVGEFGTFVTTLEDLTDADAAAIVAEHNAFPTLIAELRKRDAALRAVLAYADELEDQGHRFAAMRDLYSAGIGDARIAAAARIRSLTAALSPESVQS